jgi:hypothetical protein
MAQTLQIIIKSAIFDRERLLTITPGYIEFDDKELKSSGPIKFLLDEIVSFRHGIKWLDGFIAASVYCIDICNWNAEIIEIRLKSIYGIRENEMAEKYSTILDGLYKNYFDDISRSCLKQFESGNEFSVLNIQFSKNGIYLDEKPGLLPWNDIEVEVYYTYFTICSISENKTYKTIQSLTEWNAGILYSVLMQLLRYNKLLLSKNELPR